jgi:hypothetical protein
MKLKDERRKIEAAVNDVVAQVRIERSRVRVKEEE